jgi:hypothetical protein
MNFNPPATDDQSGDIIRSESSENSSLSVAPSPATATLPASPSVNEQIDESLASLEAENQRLKAILNGDSSTKDSDAIDI